MRELITEIRNPPLDTAMLLSFGIPLAEFPGISFKTIGRAAVSEDANVFFGLGVMLLNWRSAFLLASSFGVNCFPGVGFSRVMSTGLKSGREVMGSVVITRKGLIFWCLAPIWPKAVNDTKKQSRRSTDLFMKLKIQKSQHLKANLRFKMYRS